MNRPPTVFLELTPDKPALAGFLMPRYKITKIYTISTKGLRMKKIAKSSHASYLQPEVASGTFKTNKTTPRVRMQVRGRVCVCDMMLMVRTILRSTGAFASNVSTRTYALHSSPYLM